jgi:hypothetical protein
VKDRTFNRCAKFHSWLLRRERRAFDRMARAYTDADFSTHQRLYERIFNLRQRMIQCARERGLIPADWRAV